ncbi:hypothetical protein OH76DRAFT_1398659 [Lentinus brumalis]|uniref:Uncharacterized protein n=1 Tax=Lentinus brumalis TaxID=2498619 RepID=A0A371DP95_9APHY|nr:hypothetical protein OH76DRAFT_1398659 [Polyporus brumalis]
MQSENVDSAQSAERVTRSTRKRKKNGKNSVQEPAPESGPNHLGDIRQRLAFMCQDLRTFSANADAAERLNASVHAHFLGPPYLSADDAEFVRSCDLATLRGADAPPASGGSSQQQAKETLPKFLEKGMDDLVKARKAKSERGEEGGRDFVVCTSHDLAPLLQEACAFPKEYFETRAFREAYKRWEKEVRKAAKKGRGGAGPV